MGFVIQLACHLKMCFTWEAQTLLLRFTIRSTLMHGYVERRSGGNPWPSFCGSHILLCGIILTSSHTRSWAVSRMCMPLVLVSPCYLLSHFVVSIVTFCLQSRDHYPVQNQEINGLICAKSSDCFVMQEWWAL